MKQTKHEKIAGLMSPAQRRLLLEALEAGNTLPRTITTSTLGVFQRHELIKYGTTVAGEVGKSKKQRSWCVLTADGVKVAKTILEKENVKSSSMDTCDVPEKSKSCDCCE